MPEAASSEAHETLDVLIVEDDEDARESLRDILSLHEHRVTTAASAKSALESKVKQTLFDVILLDRKLPDGMVENLLPSFRSAAPQADLIIVTGYADLNASIAALRHGVTDYIIKPINPDALLTTLKRIASRRRMEEELREERQFAELVLQTSETIIVVVDARGRIRRFNRYLAELTGRALIEVVGCDWFDTFIPQPQRAHVRETFERTLNEGDTHRILNSILTAGGEKREFRWSNTVLKDPHGQVSGVLSVGLDVTDLMEAQRKLVQSERLAAIGQTMAGMAHESRNALQRLQNAVELLEDDLSDNEEALKYVEKISRAGNDLRDLLEEVRAYAAPIALDLSRITLPSIWRRAWQSLEHRYQAHSISLVEDLGELDPPLLVADSRRLEQVFRNLFENALDACGDAAEVSVGCEVAEQEIRIRVADDGPGMPAEQRDHVFDAFFTTKATGTGLGLAIVYRIIESHGGTIEVTDSPTGCEFVIRLPR